MRQQRPLDQQVARNVGAGGIHLDRMASGEGLAHVREWTCLVDTRKRQVRGSFDPPFKYGIDMSADNGQISVEQHDAVLQRKRAALEQIRLWVEF